MEKLTNLSKQWNLPKKWEEVTAFQICAGILLALAVKGFIEVLLYNLFSPFRRLPGPFLARLTSKWLLLLSISGKRAATVHELHRKHGKVVRLSWNELSFSGINAVRPIYGQGTTCVKAPIYGLFGREGLFQMRDPEVHRERHRRLAHVFSPASLRVAEPLVQGVVEKGMNTVLVKNTGKEVDALSWCRMISLDVAGEVLLGKAFGAFDGREDAIRFVYVLDNAFPNFLLRGFYPLVWRFLRLLPIEKLQTFLAASDYMYAYGDNSLQEFIRLYGRDSPRRSLLTKMLKGDPASGTEPLPDEIIAIEVANLIFAATDTTGTTMAYALYHLACNREWQDRLRAELRAANLQQKGYSFTELQALPVLHGIMNEALRLHPAAVGALQRMTTREIEIDGVVVPANTIVSVQSYTMHRDPSVFPDPDTFNPDRWITTSADGNPEIDHGTPAMREMFFGWGKGTRTCISMNMAIMELKILLARVINQFEVRLASEKTHRDMEMEDHYILTPKGGKCGLVFEQL